HDVIVIAVSDLDACAAYLSDVVNILEKPGVGAVTRLYRSAATNTVRGGVSALAVVLGQIIGIATMSWVTRFLSVFRSSESSNNLGYRGLEAPGRVSPLSPAIS
ncbi:MAG: glycosyltransferase, partial [Methylocella sp.]